MSQEITMNENEQKTITVEESDLSNIRRTAYDSGNLMTLDKAKKVMDNAVEKAGEFLETSPEIAELIIKQLLKCDPEHLAGLQLLGLAKHRMGENAEAIEIIQTALDIDPTCADNHNNIGLAYSGLENHERAIEYIKKAIEINPEQYLFLNNLSLQYRIIGDYEKAIKTLRDALELCPNSPQMWTNLGGMYGELKDIEESIVCFKTALKYEPGYPAAHVDLAYAYHLLGDWKKGFEEYEWRFDYFSQMDFYKKSYDQTKRWNGRNSLEGKKILIYAEQGLGDAIQFIRYVPQLKKKGAYVIVHCNPNLDALLKRCDGVDETINRDIVNNKGDEFPDYDYQCSIMSLPYLLKDYELKGTPYIKPVTENFKQFVEEEYGKEELKVGIVWAGSPAHPHDEKRSIPLKEFMPLYQTEGVKIFSLQFDTRPRKYGPGFDMGFEMRPGSDGKIVDLADGCEEMQLVDLTKMIQSLEDTCTILAGLDLVIACDTGVVHLAGAMGIPCWMCVSYNPDWRWGLEKETTSWYDSLKIFRQPQRGDWKSVFKNVKKELDETLLSNK